MGPTATLAPTATEPPTTVPALTPTGPALNPTVAGGTVAGAAAPTGSPTFDGTVDNAGSTTASDEGSSSAWIWVILVVVVIGSIGFILHQRRCRAAAADRLFEGGARSQSRAARGSSVPTAVDNQACDATDLHCQAIATDASVGGGGGGDGLRATCEDGYVEGHTAYGGPTYAVPFDDPSQSSDYLLVGGGTTTDHAPAANPPTRPESRPAADVMSSASDADTLYSEYESAQRGSPTAVRGVRAYAIPDADQPAIYDAHALAIGRVAESATHTGEPATATGAAGYLVPVTADRRQHLAFYEYSAVDTVDGQTYAIPRDTVHNENVIPHVYTNGKSQQRFGQCHWTSFRQWMKPAVIMKTGNEAACKYLALQITTAGGFERGAAYLKRKHSITPEQLGELESGVPCKRARVQE